ncbi:MAG: HEAT repeat domain-containing protein [Acidobacteria bacterium]|nr:HEAT repeat domain-containing protein [Acidobacteriota bacterium]
MSECDVVRELMPLMLTEFLGGDERESAHLHVESCPSCREAWAGYRDVWTTLGKVEERPVPAGLRNAFLDEIGVERTSRSVLPFVRRPAFRWLAQAAAVVVLVGGSFFAGQSQKVSVGPGQTAAAPATSDTPYQLVSHRVIPASQLSPDIQGAPRIDNVRFLQEPGESDLQLAFEITSDVTVTGQAGDESLGRLLAYVLESPQNTTHSRSTTIQWVSDNWSAAGKSTPELTRALARVLRNDRHEGVRLKAIDALKSLPYDPLSDTQAALVEALRNDPNPGVRLKAVEALSNLAQSGSLDSSMVDGLRHKASQDDEILHIRVKAAEALEQIDL